MKLILPTIATGLAMMTSASGVLVAHYKLDEASGNTAADSSGNGNDMAWQGTVGAPDWQAAGGVTGGGFNFTGANDDAFMTTASVSQSITLTMAVWVNTASTANDTLVYVGDGGTNNSYYTTKIQSGAARVVARNTGELNRAGAAVNDGGWHHVASVFVSDTERLIYVDGVLVGTDVRSVPGLTANRFGIGALTRGTGPVDEFTGMLDDVQVYDEALDASQVSFLHANPGQTVAVPEPSSSILMAIALGAGIARRRRA